MKTKYLLLLILFLYSANAYTQDLIIMKNGNEIEAKVIKISTEIEYKKWSNQEGPTYTLNRGDVFMIKYINGEKDIFNSEIDNSNTDNKSTTRLVQKRAAANNQSLIDRYNIPVHFANTPRSKKSKYCFPIMGVSDSSIVSTDELEMHIVPTFVFNRNCGLGHELKYAIELINKSNNIIYIDLANSFRIDHSIGTSDSFYTTEQATISQESSTNAGVGVHILANMLGVSTGKSSSVSTTYADERILAIPPHSTKKLKEYKQVHIEGLRYKTISDLETFYRLSPDKTQRLNKYEYISYSEEKSPYNREYIITYSTTQDFLHTHQLNMKMFARYLYGEDQSYNINNGISNTLKKIQKNISNFSIDQRIIIGGVALTEQIYTYPIR